MSACNDMISKPRRRLRPEPCALVYRPLLSLWPAFPFLLLQVAGIRDRFCWYLGSREDLTVCHCEEWFSVVLLSSSSFPFYPLASKEMSRPTIVRRLIERVNLWDSSCWLASLYGYWTTKAVRHKLKLLANLTACTYAPVQRTALSIHSNLGIISNFICSGLCSLTSELWTPVLLAVTLCIRILEVVCSVDPCNFLKAHFRS